MIWLALAVAICSEVTATLCLRAAGNGNVLAILAVVLGYGVSFSLLAVLVRRLDLGVVYAIWSGVGTAVVAALGMALFGEAVSGAKVFGLALVVVGVATLNLAGAH